MKQSVNRYNLRMGIEVGTFDSHSHTKYKKRKIILNGQHSLPAPPASCSTETSLPTLQSSDYFTEPCLSELATRELIDPGYCSRVPNFTVGRFGYGCVRFTGETDVRWLDLDQIIKFSRHEVVVYEDESAKPAVGKGLNKAAEVTLVLRTRFSTSEDRLRKVVRKLRIHTEQQGADFISFDPSNGEWRFSVHHFSRFGLGEDDEEDITMDDMAPQVQDPIEIDGEEVSDIDEETAIVDPVMLAHSLPAHLGLDPNKMSEMRMLMFPHEEEELDEFNNTFSHQKIPFNKESKISHLHHFSRTVHKPSPPLTRKTPLALLEYNPGSLNSNSPGSILMAPQNKTLPLRTTKGEGFKLDLEHETPVKTNHSRNIVDAALFMGRSFRVGWGPNGVLVHTGAPIGSRNPQRVLSSVINLEKVAIDQVVRDENNKVREELIDSCFDFPLSFQKEIYHGMKEIGVGPHFKLKLQKLVCNRSMLSEICRGYIDLIERQLVVPGLSSYARIVLMHQVMVWELIKVLFSSRETTSNQSRSAVTEIEEDMMLDKKESSPQVDVEALPLIRRAEFSYWLQESVCHRVQDEVSSLNESNDLEHILLLLTGRQLDAAVELAASRGDVRLACLLSQAGGSPANRADISRQLDLWRINGLDFNFIEKERVRLFELLAGDIHGALQDVRIDWKRFLGVLMWYQLPPDTSLSVVFHKYQQLLDDGTAPYPVPVYIDEGPVEQALDWHPGERFDLAYYLMLLHASDEDKFNAVKTMFSAFASTNDPLDYHMIWHQRAVLEAIGTFNCNDLHVLDMGLVSQLLCVGQCHWAIYVVLHMPYREDYPYLQANVIREILFQYCETWSNKESQRQFIEDLGVPSEWLHEALAVYFSYCGDLSKALEHFLECANWQKAHSIFVISISHPLFLSGKHSEIWRLATSMEDHKSEIENWDLGAGIFISFYLLRSSLQEDSNTMTELDTLENKKDACTDFLGRLNQSLAVWGNKLPADARVAYSRMAEEICNLLLSDSGEGSTREVQLSCYETIFSAPIPEDLRSCHLQDAVTLFTSYLSEAAS